MAPTISCGKQAVKVLLDHHMKKFGILLWATMGSEGWLKSKIIWGREEYIFPKLSGPDKLLPRFIEIRNATSCPPQCSPVLARTGQGRHTIRAGWHGQVSGAQSKGEFQVKIAFASATRFDSATDEHCP
jgi:hypothetical protein